jgi:hypothetical protein
MDQLTNFAVLTEEEKAKLLQGSSGELRGLLDLAAKLEKHNVDGNAVRSLLDPTAKFPATMQAQATAAGHLLRVAKSLEPDQLVRTARCIALCPPHDQTRAPNAHGSSTTSDLPPTSSFTY